MSFSAFTARPWARSGFARAIFAIFALCFVAIPLMGEENAEIQVIISASRIEEPAEQVPGLIVRVDKEAIRQSGATNVVQALESSLGLSFRSYSGAAQAEVSMRGFGENSSGRVLVLVDGRRLNDPDMSNLNWLSIPVQSIERIEVLQGSASVLYGGGAVGGLINIITNRAKEGVHAFGELSVGSAASGINNTQATGFSYGGRAGSLTGNVERLDYAGEREKSASDDVQARLAGDIYIGDFWQLELFGQYSNGYYEMPGALSRQEFLDRPYQAKNKEDSANLQVLEAGLLALWDRDDGQMFSMPLSYQWKNNKANLPSFANPDWGLPPSYTATAWNRIEARPQYSVKAELSALNNLPLRLVSGVDLAWVHMGVKNYTDIARSELGNAFTISQWELGPFASLAVWPVEKLSLHAGFRWDLSEINGKNSDGTANGQKLRQAPVWDTGLVYRPTESLNLFANYATTFRYPYTDEQTSYYGTGDSFNQTLEPERGNDIRLGGSWRLADVLAFSAQGYWLEMKKEIAFNSENFQNENIGNTRRLGGDFLLNLQPLRFLQANANYSYVHACFVGGPFDGKLVPLVSEHRLYAEVMGILPFGLCLGPNISWNSKAYSGGDSANAQDIDIIPARILLGASAMWEKNLEEGLLSVSVRAKNILNQAYTDYVYYGGYYPGAGRSFELLVRYEY